MATYQTNPIPFTDAEIVEYTKIADDAMEGLLKNTESMEVNADGNKWNLDFEKPELKLKVYSSTAKGFSILRFLGVCVLPFSAVKIRDFLAGELLDV
jgi:hypothetical protein